MVFRPLLLMKMHLDCPTKISFAFSNISIYLADHLILRAKLGLKSDKFKDVDYDQLLAQAREKKAKANTSYLAMKRISQTAKKTKETNLMTQHRRVWHQEFLR